MDWGAFKANLRPFWWLGRGKKHVGIWDMGVLHWAHPGGAQQVYLQEDDLWCHTCYYTNILKGIKWNGFQDTKI